MGMLQACLNLRLSLKPNQGLKPFQSQAFERNPAPQDHVPGFEHFSHTATPDLRPQYVASQTASRWLQKPAWRNY